MARHRRRGPKPTTDSRSADERLEALVREPNPERVERMLTRILDDLDARPEPAAWISAARTLSERLIISDATFIYFVELFVECIVYQAAEIDAELMRLAEEMKAIERRHGLREDETFVISEAPDDWLGQSDAWERRANSIVGEFLRANGQADIGTLYEETPAEFERRAHGGSEEFWLRFGEGDGEDR